MAVNYVKEKDDFMFGYPNVNYSKAISSSYVKMYLQSLVSDFTVPDVKDVEEATDVFLAFCWAVLDGHENHLSFNILKDYLAKVQKKVIIYTWANDKLIDIWNEILKDIHSEICKNFIMSLADDKK